MPRVRRSVQNLKMWGGAAALLFFSTSCSQGSGNHSSSSEMGSPLPRDFSGPTEVATLAGGCFWCMEAAFEAVDGVVDVVSGYSGGSTGKPTYGEVSSGRTSYAEVIQVTFDPSTLPYERLLDYFWRSMNPTDLGGQFVDRGSQYRPEIFVHSEAHRKIAEMSKAELDEMGPFDKPVVTPVTEFTQFFPAEKYHQDYYRKSPESYHRYHSGSGREAYLVLTWGENRLMK